MGTHGYLAKEVGHGEGRQVGLRSMGAQSRVGQQEAGGKRLAPRGKEGPQRPAGAETRGMVGSVAGRWDKGVE